VARPKKILPLDEEAAAARALPTAKLGGLKSPWVKMLSNPDCLGTADARNATMIVNFASVVVRRDRDGLR